MSAPAPSPARWTSCSAPRAWPRRCTPPSPESWCSGSPGAGGGVLVQGAESWCRGRSPVAVGGFLVQGAGRGVLLISVAGGGEHVHSSMLFSPPHLRGLPAVKVQGRASRPYGRAHPIGRASPRMRSSRQRGCSDVCQAMAVCTWEHRCPAWPVGGTPNQPTAFTCAGRPRPPVGAATPQSHARVPRTPWGVDTPRVTGRPPMDWPVTGNGCKA
jgi:hypothetical protein